jgi:site-specific DNA-cytosine methylase
MAAPPPPSVAVEVTGDVLAFQPVVGARARSLGVAIGLAPTLNSASGGNRTGAVLYAADIRHGKLSSVSQTIQIGPAHGWSAHATPFALHSTEMPGQIVLRRFTPVEVLALQGFDSGWLDGPRLGGKPLTDGDRYRLVGNAWPVSVAAWVLERLLSVSATQTR